MAHYSHFKISCQRGYPGCKEQVHIGVRGMRLQHPWEELKIKVGQAWAVRVGWGDEIINRIL